MTFDKFVTILEDFDDPRFVLFVEDDAGRSSLIKAYMKKYNPSDDFTIIPNNKDAVAFINSNYSKIDIYSLDYNLKMETSEPVAVCLREHGNRGDNVYIHSDDVDHRGVLTEILPNAKIAEVPKNIVDMKAI